MISLESCGKRGRGNSTRSQRRGQVGVLRRNHPLQLAGNSSLEAGRAGRYRPMTTWTVAGSVRPLDRISKHCGVIRTSQLNSKNGNCQKSSLDTRYICNDIYLDVDISECVCKTLWRAY